MKNSIPFPFKAVTGLILFTLVTCGLLWAEPVPEWSEQGFRIPQPHAVLSFPEAHGSHPGYQIEWWYLTGHLQDERNGDWFGFQATFFRNALHPPTQPEDSGAYRDDVLYLGHMALTDVASGEFHSQERLMRGSWDAYATVGDLEVRMQDWMLQRTADERFILEFSIAGERWVKLEMTPRKPLLRFGADGTSRKGEHPEARSYYLTYSDLETVGTIRSAGETRSIRGRAWMDHEISSRQLSSDLEGWDWCAIQFDDGWELKAYILRGPNAQVDPYSRVIWIDPEGHVEERGPDAFEWIRKSWWESPTTGVRYPTQVQIETQDPRSGKLESFLLTPVLPHQELAQKSAGFPYWEGAGSVTDRSGEGVGRSYLELVGYGGLGGALR